MAKKSYDFGSVKKQAQTDQQGGSSGLRGKQMKLTSGINRVFVCPPYKKGKLYKKVMVHQIWKNRKPIATATCARYLDGNDCETCTYGFKLKDKYADSKSKKKQNLWRNFMPTNDTYINVINLESDDKTPKFLKLPMDATELLLTEIDDSEDGRDIFDLDEGRPLKIKGNGEEGKDRRYKVIKFENKGANLSDDVDEDEMIKGLNDLDGLQPKFNEKKLSDLLKKLKKSLLGKVEDEEEEEEEEDDNDEVEADEDDDDSDFDDDDDDDDIEDEDDEDDEDEEEEDEDEEEEDDEEEDEEEEDEPPKKKKKKIKKLSKKKSKSKKTKKKKGR